MGFIPIRVDDLKVGLYIKLDHGWSEHPFLRNSFKVSSQKDIGIIRKQGLTKLSYDPALSDPQALEALALLSQEDNRIDSEEEVSSSHEVEEIEEATQVLQKAKEQHFKSLGTHQEAIKATEKAYQDATENIRTIVQMISASQAESVELSKQVVGAMMDILQSPSPTLTLVNASPPKDIIEEVSVHSMNVCSLSLLLGQTLDLKPEDMETLGQGAMFHNIGLQKVPSIVRNKRKDELTTRDRYLLESYPHYGRQMVEGLSGISSDCLDIISQHQENLDGSGYPEGLQGDEIAFLSMVVRVVTEYNALLKNGQGSAPLPPTQALTSLYKNMKEKCEPDIINAFISTMTIYPVGSLVRLTDDSVGLVVKTNQSERLRPLVVLYESIEASSDPVIVDLAQAQELSIKESLNPRDFDPKILAQLQQNFGGVKGYFVSD